DTRLAQARRGLTRRLSWRCNNPTNQRAKRRIYHWSVASYARGMKRTEEWDWPPRRRWRHYPSRFDVYQPSGLSPIRKKIIDIHWRVMIACIKVIFIAALTAIAFAASWLFCTVITL